MNDLVIWIASEDFIAIEGNKVSSSALCEASCKPVANTRPPAYSMKSYFIKLRESSVSKQKICLCVKRNMRSDESSHTFSMNPNLPS